MRILDHHAQAKAVRVSPLEPRHSGVEVTGFAKKELQERGIGVSGILGKSLHCSPGVFLSSIGWAAYSKCLQVLH